MVKLSEKILGAARSTLGWSSAAVGCSGSARERSHQPGSATCLFSRHSSEKHLGATPLQGSQQLPVRTLAKAGFHVSMRISPYSLQVYPSLFLFRKKATDPEGWKRCLKTQIPGV